MHEQVAAAVRGLRLSERAVPVGLGVDVEEVARWRPPSRLKPAAIFAPEELAHAGAGADTAERLAGLWCAKEAVFKAVSGHADISLRDVIVQHGPDGAPSATVRGYEQLFAGRILVSVSHTPLHAAAVAVCLESPVAESPGRPEEQPR